MLSTTEELEQLLRGSFLEKAEIRQLKIDESDQFAFALKVNCSQVIEAWELLKAYLPQTRRYPIVIEGWGADDLFSRFYYKEEVVDGKLQDSSPKSIIASDSGVNLEIFWEKQNAYDVEHLEDSIAYSFEKIAKDFGTSPEESQIRELIENGVICSYVDLEKWLLYWELENFNVEDILHTLNSEYFEWEEPYGVQGW